MADLSCFDIDEILKELTKRLEQTKIKECSDPPEFKKITFESNEDGWVEIPYCPICDKPLLNTKYDQVMEVLGLNNEFEYDLLCECGYKHKY